MQTELIGMEFSFKFYFYSVFMHLQNVDRMALKKINFGKEQNFRPVCHFDILQMIQTITSVANCLLKLVDNKKNTILKSILSELFLPSFSLTLFPSIFYFFFAIFQMICLFFYLLILKFFGNNVFF